jgi:hypothetical protein
MKYQVNKGWTLYHILKEDLSGEWMRQTFDDYENWREGDWALIADDSNEVFCSAPNSCKTVQSALRYMVKNQRDRAFNIYNDTPAILEN